MILRRSLVICALRINDRFIGFMFEKPALVSGLFKLWWNKYMFRLFVVIIVVFFLYWNSIAF